LFESSVRVVSPGNWPLRPRNWNYGFTGWTRMWKPGRATVVAEGSMLRTRSDVEPSSSPPGSPIPATNSDIFFNLPCLIRAQSVARRPQEGNPRFSSQIFTRVKIRERASSPNETIDKNRSASEVLISTEGSKFEECICLRLLTGNAAGSSFHLRMQNYTLSAISGSSQSEDASIFWRDDRGRPNRTDSPRVFSNGSLAWQ
jgi:hypothetical protein